MPRKLAVVPPNAAAPKKPPANIKQAADASERDLLVALRSHLAMEMDKGAVPAHALAGVSAKIREYDREIRALDAREAEEAAESGDVADEAWDAQAL